MGYASISTVVDFDAAHRLWNTVDKGHKCSKIHGHTYRVLVRVSLHKTADEKIPEMIIDFADLKKIVKKYTVDKYDHSLILNQNDELVKQHRDILEQYSNLVLLDRDPTAEVLAETIVNDIKNDGAFASITDDISITVYESAADADCVSIM